MQPDQPSLTFAALAAPPRRSILTRLAEGEATVNELAEPFPVSLPAISRHLKVLERAGLIVRSREAHRGPPRQDPESTRLNSSHMSTSYAAFCFRKTSPRVPT